MARATGTTARVQRLTSLVATLLVASAIGIAFGRVFEGRPTTFLLLGVGIASALLAWAFERRSLLLATMVSGAALILVLGLLVFRETTWYGLPALETLRAMGSAAAAVGEQARINVAPSAPIDALVFASATAVWAAVFSCHALAFRAGSPLLALVPPLALVAFADSVLEEFVRPIYGLLFLVAGLSVIFADSLRRVQGWGPVWNGPGRRDRLMSSAGRTARRLGGAAVTVAIAAPFVVPGFGSKAVIDLSSVNSDQRINVSPLVSLAAQLTSGDEIEVFRVRTTAPSYWRMTALDNFDGIEWTAVPRPTQQVSSGQALPGEPATPSGLVVAQNFTIQHDVGYPWLPAAPSPASIAIGGPVTWDPISQTLTVADPLEEGDTYQVTSSYPEPTADQLRRSAADTGDPQLLQLPVDLSPEIRQLAERWTRGATSDLDRVLAIQQHLASSGRFRYSTDVAPRDDAATLVDFLKVSRAGFCQQFAASMAVMLRSIGIPARVAFGYARGNVVGDPANDEYSVTTKDLHSWVEVPFVGYGWLPFEPTPGRTNPAAASYLQQGSVTPCKPTPGRSCQEPPNGPKGNPSAPHGSKRPQIDIPVPGGSGLAPTTEPRRVPLRPIALAVLLAALAGLAAVPASRWARRRRELRRAEAEPRRLILATYDVFTQRAGDLGLGRRPGETPTEYRLRIEATGRLEDGHLDRLTDLTVQAAYAPAPLLPADALDATADALEALRQLRHTTSWQRRVRGVYRRD